MGSHSTLRAHFDTLITALDILPKEYYKISIQLRTTCKKFYYQNLSIEQVKQRIKFVSVAMCSLVMSLCSRDVITIY